MGLPLVDLGKQFTSIREEMLLAIEEVISKSAFIQGEYVAQFERAYASTLGAAHCAGCSSGTSALFLALSALDVGPGDEVITTPFTFMATVEAIYHTGARPVFVDIDPHTYALDTRQLEAAITPRTRVILPVHLYGNPVEMDPIKRIAKARGLAVVEDCAQAHLATYHGAHAGTLGDISCFSFFPGKNLGAYGDAGAVVTGNAELAQKMRKLLDHGRTDKYRHTEIGYNHRLDGLQAAVLSVKLRHLQSWTEARRRHAAAYNERLKNLPCVKIAQPTPGSEPVYHLYVIEVDNRDRVAAALKEKGISAAVHYPIPCHLQPALSALGLREGSFPVAERAATRVLSLPIFAELQERDIDNVCSALKSVL